MCGDCFELLVLFRGLCRDAAVLLLMLYFVCEEMWCGCEKLFVC